MGRALARERVGCVCLAVDAEPAKYCWKLYTKCNIPDMKNLITDS